MAGRLQPHCWKEGSPTAKLQLSGIFNLKPLLFHNKWKGKAVFPSNIYTFCKYAFFQWPKIYLIDVMSSLTKMMFNKKFLFKKKKSFLECQYYILSQKKSYLNVIFQFTNKG